MTVELPHFTLPFAFTRSPAGGLGAAVVEQESIAEIGGCVEAIIRTVQGQRTTLPDFGVPQLEFNTSADATRAAIAASLIEFEPRVTALIEAAPDADDPTVQDVRALVSPTDAEQGDIE
jgi:phage baseplate assembly protein W